MRNYVVGGAVRDELLGLPVVERDFVVVGESPEAMLAQGFRAVGKDFPVFLHPKTQEEYALARTERKTAPGYHGFEIHASPEVTLEEDLVRRDLTVNAMAMDESGQLIDPYGGLQDLHDRVLRHVSPAFAEDPVRLLRVARFAARFNALGFTIAPETLRLMQAMVDQGEVDALVPERIFQEFHKALLTGAPQVFIEVLRMTGALSRIMPEIDQLFGIPQDPRHHPEVDTGGHSLLVLQQAAGLSLDPAIRFAALVHDLGKGLTDPGLWPHHPGHEAAGIQPLETLCERLKAPRAFFHLAKKAVLHHGTIHRALTLSAESLVDLMEQLDGFRQPEMLADVLCVAEADARGRPGYEALPYPQRGRVLDALKVAQRITGKTFTGQKISGPALGQAIRQGRIDLIEKEILSQG